MAEKFLVIYRFEDEPYVMLMTNKEAEKWLLNDGRDLAFLTAKEIRSENSDLREFPANTAIFMKGIIS